MNEKEITDAAIAYIKELFAGNADGHDADHTLRVYVNAEKLLSEYPEADGLVVRLAALLHDADDHKLFKTENNANARGFMKEHGVPDETAEVICTAINSVSFSKNRGKKPGTLEGCIVQDADRLDALGAVGIARTFAYGGRAGRGLSVSIDHFHEKLLLLKDEMNTDAARKIAEKRHRFLVEFLDEYEEETK